LVFPGAANADVAIASANARMSSFFMSIVSDASSAADVWGPPSRDAR
jgi:hypothetical protein